MEQGLGERGMGRVASKKGTARQSDKQRSGRGYVRLDRRKAGVAARGAALREAPGSIRLPNVLGLGLELCFVNTAENTPTVALTVDLIASLTTSTGEKALGGGVSTKSNPDATSAAAAAATLGVRYCCLSGVAGGRSDPIVADLLRCAELAGGSWALGSEAINDTKSIACCATNSDGSRRQVLGDGTSPSWSPRRLSLFPSSSSSELSRLKCVDDDDDDRRRRRAAALVGIVPQGGDSVVFPWRSRMGRGLLVDPLVTADEDASSLFMFFWLGFSLAPSPSASLFSSSQRVMAPFVEVPSRKR